MTVRSDGGEVLEQSVGVAVQLIVVVERVVELRTPWPAVGLGGDVLDAVVGDGDGGGETVIPPRTTDPLLNV